MMSKVGQSGIWAGSRLISLGERCRVREMSSRYYGSLYSPYMLLSKNFTQFFFDADLEERLRVTKLLMYSEKIASWVKANTRITPVNTSPISKRYLSNSTWQTYEDLSLRQATSFSLILNPRGSLLSCCFVKGDKSFSSTWIRSMAEKWSTLAFYKFGFTCSHTQRKRVRCIEKARGIVQITLDNVGRSIPVIHGGGVKGGDFRTR